jgi:NAD(P)-dependent dehydrogenase (short-subunit alcohol dehydrogenase family)
LSLKLLQNTLCTAIIYLQGHSSYISLAMPSRQCNKNQNGSEKLKSSKDLDPLPSNIGAVFIQNQFKTTIELPTKDAYPQVEGKCAIVTGSNTGLGFEAAKQLLSLGLAHLVMGVRSLDKGKAAAKQLASVNPSAKIEVWHLDMESYDSIQIFVSKCQESLPQIHFAILNAGVSVADFSIVPATGHERTMQVNHMSTALLAIKLLPFMSSKTQDQDVPRLTIVNSLTAHTCRFPNRSQRPLLASFDDTSITPWDQEERYGVSKLISQLFLVKLAENISPDRVIINMVDPGLTKGTNLFKDTSGVVAVFARVFFAIAGRPVDRGAATYIDAILDHGKESHGCFLMSCQISP